MKKILLPILLLASFYSFGFDYHGIKSGMSGDEVKALTGCEYKSSCSDDEVGEDKIFNKSLGINPPNLWSAAFAYTTDGKLWRITLNFREASFARGVAQQKALDQLYSSVTKTTERIGGSSQYAFNVDILAAMLIDESLFKQDADKIFKETIDLY
jgi:carotenoid cleavage dioxygenase-like enzyme